MKWKLKRNDNSDEIELTAAALWKDEHDWSDLAQSNPVYTLGGAMELQQGAKKAGRPITLVMQESELLTRADYDTLQKWTAVAELQMTLTHPDLTTSNVVFRTHEGAIECSPVFHMIPAENSDPFKGIVKLMKAMPA